MPSVHPTAVISFSSEDPNHPANNLLNRDTFRKWKCKEAGEKEGFVILKFDKAIKLTAIDIGNECSAMVEIFVGRSGSDNIKYEVLLSSSVLMSPTDSRNLNNPNGVRNYPGNMFDKETSSQKWDLIKIVVSQIFNKQTQFGLTFVKFTAAPNPDDPVKIGVFSLRKPLGLTDEDDESLPSRIGALFAKSVADKNRGVDIISLDNFDPTCKSTSAAIRDASKAISSAAQMSSEKVVKDALKKPTSDLNSSGSNSLSLFKKQNNDPSPPNRNSSLSRNGEAVGESDKLPSRNTLADSPFVRKKTNQNPNSSQQQPSPKSSTSSRNDQTPSSTSGQIRTKAHNNQDPTGQLSTPSKKDEDTRIGNNSTGKGNLTQTQQSSKLSLTSKTDGQKRGSSSSNTSKNKNKNTKPFGKLFEGVIFVMSGFQNPYRKELRDKAIEMGARCKPDWDSTCTHLIGAFVNTPKFNQVRRAGNGKIVKKEWITRSYSSKCRFPWRRFCLDRNDEGDESEEEIFGERVHEEEEIPEQPSENETSSPSDSPRNRNNDESLTESMKVDDEPKDSKEEDKSPKRNGRKRILVVESSDSEIEANGENVYDVDTDVDEKDLTLLQVSKKSKNDDESGSNTDFEEDQEKKVVTSIKNQDDGTNAQVDSGFFENSVFFLSFSKNDSSNQKSQIEQIISNHNGKNETHLNEAVQYYIILTKEWTVELSEALSDNPNLSFVHADWIFECEKENKMTSCQPYIILHS